MTNSLFYLKIRFFTDSLTFGQGPQGTFDFEREWKTDKWQDLVGYQNSETESVTSRER